MSKTTRRILTRIAGDVALVGGLAIALALWWAFLIAAPRW